MMMITTALEFELHRTKCEWLKDQTDDLIRTSCEEDDSSSVPPFGQPHQETTTNNNNNDDDTDNEV